MRSLHVGNATIVSLPLIRRKIEKQHRLRVWNILGLQQICRQKALRWYYLLYPGSGSTDRLRAKCIETVVPRAISKALELPWNTSVLSIFLLYRVMPSKLVGRRSVYDYRSIVRDITKCIFKALNSRPQVKHVTLVSILILGLLQISLYLSDTSTYQGQQHATLQDTRRVKLRIRQVQ
jgi:hypothetical protein